MVYTLISFTKPASTCFVVHVKFLAMRDAFVLGVTSSCAHHMHFSFVVYFGLCTILWSMIMLSCVICMTCWLMHYVVFSWDWCIMLCCAGSLLLISSLHKPLRWWRKGLHDVEHETPLTMSSSCTSNSHSWSLTNNREKSLYRAMGRKRPLQEEMNVFVRCNSLHKHELK